MAIHQRDKEKRKSACIKSLRKLAQKIGHTPSEQDYKKHYSSIEGAPTPSQLRYEFGTWTAAVKGAGLTPLPTAPPRNDIPNENLIAEFVRVANNLGRLPSLEVFRNESKFSNVPYKRRWGPWSKVQSYFASNHAKQFSFVPCVNKLSRTLPKPQKLSIDCPLVNEPRNEFETIALFTLLAKDLGYRILSIQSEFPDATLEKDGVEVQAEFEFLSSNYLSHCHELSPDILCVCWRVDCDLSPVKVLCLEDIIHADRA
jgi:hypothetical protein